MTSGERIFLVKQGSNQPNDSITSYSIRSSSNVEKCYRNFFENHSCYDLIPLSAKLIVFDITLNVTKAFYALVYNSVRVATLWDSDKQEYVGMLTITDFIRILTHHNDREISLEEVENNQIKQWRETLCDQSKELICVRPEESLLDAVCKLLKMNVHRLPVIDKITGNPLHILTHKRILKYLHMHMHQLPVPPFMKKTLKELDKLGTRKNVAKVYKNTILKDALMVFLEKRVSALPVVEEGTDKLVDIYAKFDVINLAATRTYQNLGITVYEALNYRRQHFSGVSTCKLSNTLQEIIDQIVDAGVHRLVMTDEDSRVLGIVSLSDILRFLVFNGN